MIYQVMNRQQARQETYNEKAPVTAIISITDIGDEPNKFLDREWIAGILRLQFNDIYGYSEQAIQKQHAKEIAKFVWSMYSKIERFLVHCEYGQSRSAGVAAAICMYYEGHMDCIVTENVFKPNPYCLQPVLKALNKKKFK